MQKNNISGHSASETSMCTTQKALNRQENYAVSLFTIVITLVALWDMPTTENVMFAKADRKENNDE